MSDDFGNFYRENGYAVLRDLFKKEDIENALLDIFDLFETRFSDVNDHKLSGSSLLVYYYEKEKEIWRQCARHMYDLLSVYRLATMSNVIEVLRKIGLKKPMISIRPEVRTDMPNDERYMQLWHQDWRSGQGSLNAATIWVPLHKVSVENGAIEVIPASHLMGLLKTEILQNPLRFSVVDPRIQNLQYFPVELEVGESIVFSQMLAHRSGRNQTNSPRVTVQLRYVDYAESSYVKQGYPGGLYRTGSELLWKDPPSESDMRRVYEVYS